MHISVPIALTSSLNSLISAAALHRQPCNPAEPQAGPFQLAALDPATNQSTGLAVSITSRSVHILTPTADGSLEGADTFTYDSEARRLDVPGVGSSDDAIVGNPLTFGVFPSTGESGGLAVQAVSGCFEGARTPMFLVVGNGSVSDELALTGWNTCGNSGLFWTGDGLPEGICVKVGVQIMRVGTPD
ncbi:hypothetical protein F4677DRAFT_433568 [Hypoxylon crocopeplum]|nr:hypothetical protein F4677DRAFT_433568 [Hypoxylon crocopeplum]